MRTRDLNLIEDPSFYQYISQEEITAMNTVELTIALGLIRKEHRRLKEKAYVRGSYKRAAADQIDIDNEKKAFDCRATIEQVLFDKQGWVPRIVTEAKQRELVALHRSFMKRITNQETKK